MDWEYFTVCGALTGLAPHQVAELISTIMASFQTGASDFNLGPKPHTLPAALVPAQPSSYTWPTNDNRTKMTTFPPRYIHPQLSWLLVWTMVHLTWRRMTDDISI